MFVAILLSNWAERVDDVKLELFMRQAAHYLATADPRFVRAVDLARHATMDAAKVRGILVDPHGEHAAATRRVTEYERAARAEDSSDLPQLRELLDGDRGSLMSSEPIRLESIPFTRKVLRDAMGEIRRREGYDDDDG